MTFLKLFFVTFSVTGSGKNCPLTFFPAIDILEEKLTGGAR